MADILYLTHRMPFPPDKGDKIATFNLLRHLAAHHQVHLGSFVDSEDDWQHVGTLKQYCASTKLVGIQPRWRKWLSGRAVLGGASISEIYHRNNELQSWVNETVARLDIRHGLIYCSAMAPYLADKRFANMRKVAHYSDVDSEKWKTYVQTHAGPMSWVYGREARTLLALERRMSLAYDVTAFVSDADAALYRELAPESAERIEVIPNGVDTEYFDPDKHHDSPFETGEKPIVFTGAMDYWPNADAVTWFAQEVLPGVRKRVPEAWFWIVGSNPGTEVQKLAELPGVRVTGRVPEVLPYLAHADAVVAPLRVARGTQNKVLEAFAMARSVVLTPAAANGLQTAPFIAQQTHEEPQAMAVAVANALAQPRRCEVARRYVMERYSWTYAFGRLDAAMQIGNASTR